MTSKDVQQAAQVIRDGGIVAYPTEAVYGLGCDPHNHNAIKKLLTIKRRSSEAGFILIASHWSQIEKYIGACDQTILNNIQASWPGPITWLLPASEQVPALVHGKHQQVALRISAHPTVKALCDTVGHAIISTSANRHGEIMFRDADTVKKEFSDEIDFILLGEVGPQKEPTEIRDAMTGQTIRATAKEKEDEHNH